MFIGTLCPLHSLNIKIYGQGDCFGIYLFYNLEWNILNMFFDEIKQINLEGVIPLCGKIPLVKTPTPDCEQQWAPNTIQTIIMICNAKGIPSAIAQKL